MREKNSVAFSLPDVLEVVSFGLESVSPQLADELPADLDVTLLTLQKREFARQSLVAADRVRLLGIVLPLIAILLLSRRSSLSQDRRVGVLRAAVAVAAAGFVLAITLVIFKRRIIAGTYGADETTDEEIRDAVGGLLDAFFGELGPGRWCWLRGRRWSRRPRRCSTPRTSRARSRACGRASRRPRSRAAPGRRGSARLALGAFIALEPDARSDRRAGSPAPAPFLRRRRAAASC